MAKNPPSREFLNLFWDLASDEATKRITSAENIIRHLREADSEGTEYSPDVDYSLKRLIKGLSSSRESARLGFAACLAELLSFKSINIALVIELLDENTKVSLRTPP